MQQGFSKEQVEEINTHAIFAVFDQNGDGTLDYEDVMQLISLQSRACDRTKAHVAKREIAETRGGRKAPNFNIGSMG